MLRRLFPVLLITLCLGIAGATPVVADNVDPDAQGLWSTDQTGKETCQPPANQILAAFPDVQRQINLGAAVDEDRQAAQCTWSDPEFSLSQSCRWDYCCGDWGCWFSCPCW